MYAAELSADESKPLPDLPARLKLPFAQERTISLSNLWTTGTSEESFWAHEGLTNAPVELAIPGGSQYKLFIGNGGLMPFLGRRGSANQPNAIWRIPKFRVDMGGGGKEKYAELGKCTMIGFDAEKLALRDGTKMKGILWSIWSDRNGFMRIEIAIEPGW